MWSTDKISILTAYLQNKFMDIFPAGLKMASIFKSGIVDITGDFCCLVVPDYFRQVLKGVTSVK